MGSDFKQLGWLYGLTLICIIIVLGINFQGFIAFIAALLGFALVLLRIGLKIRRIIK